MRRIQESGCRRIGFIGLSFKPGTDDLRESPLVSLAEHLIGKGAKLLVYDPDVQLSNLLGANRRFIEQHLPHIGSMIDADIGKVARECDLLVVALATPAVLGALAPHVRPGQVVLDLAGMPENALPGADVRGLCW
jgi:GDP-mannose 6-dehydrogenase